MIFLPIYDTINILLFFSPEIPITGIQIDIPHRHGLRNIQLFSIFRYIVFHIVKYFIVNKKDSL